MLGRVSFRPLSLTCRWPPPMCARMAFTLLVSESRFSLLIKTCQIIRWIPLLTSFFYPITFLKTLSPTLVHTCNPMTWEVEAEDQKFKVILDYIMSSKAAWDTFYQKKCDGWLVTLVYIWDFMTRERSAVRKTADRQWKISDRVEGGKEGEKKEDGKENLVSDCSTAGQEHS